MQLNFERFKIDQSQIKKIIRNLDERKIILVITVLLLIFLLLGMLLQEDPVEAFSRTAEKFARTTSEYSPEDAVRMTTGTARALVMSQSERITRARAAGFQTKVDQVKTEVLSQRKGFISAKVMVWTTETWPGKPPEKFIHVFIMEGERLAQTWKISNLVEAEVSKTQ